MQLHRPAVSRTAVALAAADGAAARPHGCTNFLLRQLMRRLDQHYDAELGKAGLKTTQYSLLSHVVRLGPIGPGVLAQAMKMQPSTLTRNVQALLREGWVVMRPGADGRSRSVSATPSGCAKRLQAMRHWKAAQESVERALGRDHLLQLHQVMADSMQRLDTLALAERPHA